MNYPKKKLSMISVVFAFAALMFFTCLKTDVFAANPKVTNLKQIGATDTSIDISWNAPLGAEHFTVYISEYRNFPENATKKEHTYSSYDYIYGLNPNHTYFVKVIPDSIANAAYDFSDIITCTTAPEGVRSVTHTSSTASSISVSWEAPFSGAEYYKVYYKPTSSSMQEIYAGTTSNKSFTVSNLIDDTEYSIYVYPIKKSANGFEAVGSTGYKSYVATIAKANKFSQLKLESFNASSTTASVSFHNDCQRQSGIEIEISSLSGKKIKSIKASQYASSISFSLSSIKNKGFKYRLRAYVTASNKYCYGPYTKSNVVVAHPKVTASKKSNSSLNLKWSKISGAKSYTIYLAKEKNDNYKKVATVKSNKYTLKKLKPYKDYYIYVKANGVKSGKKSYSSTKAKYQPITNVYYYKNIKGVSNYYTTYTND